MKVLNILVLLILNFYFIKTDEEIFNQAMNDLEDLESYIKAYITEKSYTGSSLTHLIVCFIRLGAYSSSEWQIAGGEIPTDLVEYITSKDEENETSSKKVQSYREIITPNGDKIDFEKMVQENDNSTLNLRSTFCSLIVKNSITSSYCIYLYTPCPKRMPY